MLAARPGRSATSDSAGPSGLDGAATGCPWVSRSRTWGMPVTVQVLVEALRSWMVTQMVPAAPSLAWTDPRSAEGSQRSVAGPPLRGLVVQVGVSGPGPGCGLALGERPAAAGDWAVAAGSRSAMEWAVQPATA